MAALRRNPPFRAEQVGSLLRPEKLLKARADSKEGKISQQELLQIENASVKEVVELQIELGFHSITDGEYRRSSFTSIPDPEVDVYRTYMPNIAAFTDVGQRPPESVFCTGKIKHTGSTYTDQWNYLKNIVPSDKARGCKLTLPAPELYHFRYREGKSYPPGVYKNDSEFFADIAAAYQAELQILYDHGLRNAQIDDPNLAYFCDEKMLTGWAADPANTSTSDEMLTSYIDLYNACISKRPGDMHVGVHLCRGNFANSKHFSEGGYERVAKRIFDSLDVDTYYLEYDTPRAGGFEPLRHLPKNKNVVLGVVTSKFPQLEDLDMLKGRVLEAAEIVAEGNMESREEALGRMGVSPQCGFASAAEGNALGRDDMVKKLELVRKLAEEVWPGEA
ncbi:uncharacterized protein KY384_008169 [Bacidia gigantensis]|uniref:uncharacterized protein n=1 Tax=Bacidia gigantensis TaxID=2732470 RepID=UPI001D047ACE|nr:uncharacterized protein KY384_008169 [Bacidia gigantensis]KAG8526740.1 hypothetical protein KY384_008169 [Bacidia gigantensis]